MGQTWDFTQGDELPWASASSPAPRPRLSELLALITWILSRGNENAP